MMEAVYHLFFLSDKKFKKENTTNKEELEWIFIKSTWTINNVRCVCFFLSKCTHK